MIAPIMFIATQRDVYMTFNPDEDLNTEGPDARYSLDDFLGGRVRLYQPVAGYRVSMDTVMLAASVPAKAGQRVLEAGTGTGAAALCVATRVPGVEVVGVEVQDCMMALAERNIHFNGMVDRVRVVKACVTCPPEQFKQGSFDHVFANPPYLEEGHAVRPPEKNKGLAHMNSSATLKDWVKFMLEQVKDRGTVSFVHRADRIDELMHLLYGRVGDIVLCPLWPREGVAAKRVLVQGRKGVRGSSMIHPGIFLHGAVDRYTKEAEDILRHGAAIQLRQKNGRPLCASQQAEGA